MIEHPVPALQVDSYAPIGAASNTCEVRELGSSEGRNPKLCPFSPPVSDGHDHGDRVVVGGVFVLLPDGGAIGHVVVHLSVRHPRPVRGVGVEEVLDPFPVPGVVEDRVLEAGGLDGFELQVRP
jgi:hypothetical protein